MHKQKCHLLKLDGVFHTNIQVKLTAETNFVRVKCDRIHKETHYVRDQLGNILCKVTKPLVFMDLCCACYKVFIVGI